MSKISRVCASTDHRDMLKGSIAPAGSGLLTAKLASIPARAADVVDPRTTPFIEARPLYGEPVIVHIYNNLPQNHIGYESSEISIHVDYLHGASKATFLREAHDDRSPGIALALRLPARCYRSKYVQSEKLHGYGLI